ncbi:ABC transporter family substrate-binding protein [Lentzea aerocolonigenes]|uniref:ABC transporter family substrate-binding protein n=1 Tax=Lentzea aerocolonigenes TaxID=68170 RepID=UPI0004C3F71F|nr:ABC transporter family substrate-binding protein [Lentzea aerocolonigenes]MCP2251221.1 peptide/nickel transport system substrate-binding protein [Lentzea aerocolonigenes]
MRRTKALPAIALVASASLVLGACGGGGGSNNADGGDATVADMATARGESADGYTAPDTKQSDQVVVSTDKPFTSYNNATEDANQSYNTFALTLVQPGAHLINGNNKVILNKDVMDGIEVTSKSPQVVTWKLKKGVTWSDGEAWDCDDFYMAWFTQSNSAKKADGSKFFKPAGTTGYDLMTGACKDDQTFVGTFSAPYPDYEDMFNTDVLPAHILEKQTGVADITKVNKDSAAADIQKVADFWNEKWNGFTKELMPGAGTYVLTGFEPNQSVTLERNPKWVGKPGGPAKIILKAIPDPVAQAQALENGELAVNSFAQPDANAATKLKGLNAQGVTFGAGPGLSFEHLDLQMKNPVLAKEEIRKAFFMCVKRQDIIDKLISEVQSDAKPMGSLIFFPKDEGYKDNYADKAKGDPAAAKKILGDAGWTQGADGVFAKDGVRASFRISHTDIPRRKQTVELIQGQCKEAGIEVKDDTDPNFLDERVSAGDYDVALFAWSGSPFKGGKKSIYETGGGQNWQNLSVPKADEAMKQAVSQTSISDSLKNWAEADAALADSYGSLPLFQMPNMWAFKGLDRVYFQSYFGALWDANEWQTK